MGDHAADRSTRAPWISLSGCRTSFSSLGGKTSPAPQPQGEVRLDDRVTGQAERLGQVRLSLTWSVAIRVHFVNKVK